VLYLSNVGYLCDSVVQWSTSWLAIQVVTGSTTTPTLLAATVGWLFRRTCPLTVCLELTTTTYATSHAYRLLTAVASRPAQPLPLYEVDKWQPAEKENAVCLQRGFALKKTAKRIEILLYNNKSTLTVSSCV